MAMAIFKHVFNCFVIIIVAVPRCFRFYNCNYKCYCCWYCYHYFRFINIGPIL